MTQPFLEPPIYQVAGLQYSPTSGAIKNEEGKVIRLRAREANLFTALIDSFPDILSRQSIEEQLWKGSYATNATINQTIKALRFSLDDDQRSLIRTIPKQGYVLSSKPYILESYTAHHMAGAKEPAPGIVPDSTANSSESVTLTDTPQNSKALGWRTFFSGNELIGIGVISLLLFTLGYLGIFSPSFERISYKAGEHWLLFDATSEEINSLNLSDDTPSIIMKNDSNYRICHVEEGITVCKNQ
ncbi:hypothetical protein BCV39_04830 [Vibrio sp. 10N.286.55.E10]|uniref:winged helix-turn-helix domain-containing protein n=1 Tax=Vibrio TaxID=662 RepID=UPI000C85ED9E|nr:MULTISPECIES: winged helix-turn-helix domain-containing protein [unclassified Vibrio]CAK3909994.1 OmpR/PhoB-type domain-containing protein [Vibrio crassostreae]PME34091.1 hypothetical protein BCV39_04830 [Vibrio sp. 10N.286.55.E10]PME40092.1 hypothetical protein BCV40_22465 [Vibrio sp. 10N.286.55.E12]PME63614.1 hypothetical protein BCV32_02165 [Vibrio sp. 10N.286.55.C11]PMI18799.1 hypothetical protein BCU50_21105 [Vibrio sp. 10N.286.46.E10]